jgi:hypothetical protein
MLATCFSTARSVTTKDLAIAGVGPAFGHHLVGRGTAGQALPLQQAGQLGMGRAQIRGCSGTSHIWSMKRVDLVDLLSSPQHKVH